MRVFSATARLGLGALLAAIALAGCHHADPTPAAPTVTAEYDASARPTVVPLAYTAPPPTKPLAASYALDLDNAQTMPQPAGMPTIPAPWAAGAAGSYSADLRDDHKRADGWELFYSSFSTQLTTGLNYLALYNTYRGVLRLYFYFPASQNAQDFPTYIGLASTLVLEGTQRATSPVLGFGSQAVVSTTQPAHFASSVDAQPLANGTWFVTQYELAYDPAISNQDITKLSFRWQLNACELQGLQLAGTSLPNLPVSLQIPEVNFADPGSSDRTFSYAGPVLLALGGPASVASLQRAGLPAAGAQQLLGQAATAPWYTGQVLGPGGSAGSLASVPVQGRLTTRADVGLTSLFLALPGYDNSSITGSAPQYNAAPGVFFLQGAPIVSAQPAGNGQPYVYKLDVSSVKYLFNPAVQAIADIQHLRQEVIATPVGGGLDGPTYAGTTLTSSQELTVQGVRVSFDVVPRNGSSPVHITKTFAATLR